MRKVAKQKRPFTFSSGNPAYLYARYLLNNCFLKIIFLNYTPRSGFFLFYYINLSKSQEKSRGNPGKLKKAINEKSLDSTFGGYFLFQGEHQHTS